MPTVTYTFAANTKAQSAQVNQNFQDVASAIRPTFAWAVTGSLVTGASAAPYLVATHSLTIEKAYASIKTAPTGSSIIIDINKNGSTIWSTQANRLTVAAGATSGTQTIFNTTSLSDGDVLRVDLDQVGSSTSGSDLTIQLKCS